MHIPKALRSAFFYRTSSLSAFEVSFSIRKKFSKKKSNGEIAFALISLFHVQIQEPANRSTTMPFLQNFSNYHKIYVTKYLKQEVNDNLSIFVHEHSLCGLSLTGDIKIYQCYKIKR